MDPSQAESKGRQNSSFKKSRILFVAVVLAVLGLLIWRGGDWVPPPQARTLLVYCFSGMQEVMEEAIFPGFQETWLRDKNEKMEFVATFAGSGEVARKILARFPAEVAILASDLDAARLTSAQQPIGLPHKGLLARTPLLIAVREGNPLQIAGFEDLAKPGVRVVCPDPLTSGAGQWALLAIHGAARRGGDSVQATQILDRVWSNISTRPSSAREATNKFLGGEGDALLGYEANWVSTPRRPAVAATIVHPPGTIVCEPKVVPVQSNITPKQKQLADAFVAYLWTRPAQEALARYGFRPVDESVPPRDDLATLPDAFDLQSLGGLRTVKTEILEPFLRRH